MWLGRVLRFIGEAFDSELRPINPNTASTSMLKAVASFIDRHIDAKEADWTEMAERLGAAGSGTFGARRSAIKAANGGAFWVNHYRAMVELWNYRRQSNKLHWRTTGSLAQLGTASTPAANQRGGSSGQRRRKPSLAATSGSGLGGPG